MKLSRHMAIATNLHYFLFGYHQFQRDPSTHAHMEILRKVEKSWKVFGTASEEPGLRLTIAQLSEEQQLAMSIASRKMFEAEEGASEFAFAWLVVSRSLTIRLWVKTSLGHPPKVVYFKRLFVCSPGGPGF